MGEAAEEGHKSWFYCPKHSKQCCIKIKNNCFSFLLFYILQSYTFSLHAYFVSWDTEQVPGETSVIVWLCVVLLFSSTLRDRIVWPRCHCIRSAAALIVCEHSGDAGLQESHLFSWRQAEGAERAQRAAERWKRCHMRVETSICLYRQNTGSS